MQMQAISHFEEKAEAIDTHCLCVLQVGSALDFTKFKLLKQYLHITKTIHKHIWEQIQYCYP